MSFSRFIPPLVGVPPQKNVEDIPMVQGEVHAKFCPDSSSSLGGKWRQTNKQMNRQTDTPFCFIYNFIYLLKRKFIFWDFLYGFPICTVPTFLIQIQTVFPLHTLISLFINFLPFKFNFKLFAHLDFPFYSFPPF